ncbi:rhomboid family intramembrane serine protease [Vulcaniibacterium tengchongense]|uniref:Membrane associated rhomboid family serine protease n=1 Tax=Vulcaniibacterium tengchongense TaxID=1273429 RepID=A0A3N4VPR5_9GAMM|nr:rhomboid family intramembrane serine protease [Vulcaniibacterium tengchongense]RPE81879.1 membrane associated rhomboid family serine protease [Vulcaniibacterium tengchongense]
MLTLALIAVTVLVSWLAFQRPRLIERLILWPPAVDRQRQYDRLLTHGLVHADWGHLLFNMITLFFFGRVIESVVGGLIGPLGFVLFYLSAIVVAILPSYLRHRHDPHYRSLGASGAVSAVLFAYVLLQPWSLIIVLVVPVPAILYAVVYVAYSFWMDKRGGDNINHNAHLSGAIYGVLFMLLMEPRLGGEFLRRLASPGF